MNQLQHFYAAHRRVADVNEQFMEFVREGMTREELQRNIDRRPELWGRFSNWLDRLPGKDVSLEIVWPTADRTKDVWDARAKLPAEDHPLFDATVQRAWQHAGSKITLYLADRVPLDAPAWQHAGWLEYSMWVHWPGTQAVRPAPRDLFIGCIQRRPGEKPEFHS